MVDARIVAHCYVEHRRRRGEPLRFFETERNTVELIIADLLEYGEYLEHPVAAETMAERALSRVQTRKERGR